MEMLSTESDKDLDSPKKPRGAFGVLCMRLTEHRCLSMKVRPKPTRGSMHEIEYFVKTLPTTSLGFPPVAEIQASIEREKIALWMEIKDWTYMQTLVPF